MYEPSSTIRTILALLLAACVSLNPGRPSDAGRQSLVETIGRRSKDSPADEESRRPNVLFVLLDDVRDDAFGFSGHPFSHTPVIDGLAREGVCFRESFVAISLCSPSRATILSGCRPQRTGVFGNSRTEIDSRVPTLPELLRDSGYRTGFFGKWHLGTGVKERRGFDHWLSFVGQGDYQDPDLWENGVPLEVEGYITDILCDKVVEWLERGDPDRPFLAYLSHKAVHVPFVPADRHRDSFSDAKVQLPASFFDDLYGKPSYIRAERLRRTEGLIWDGNAEELPARIPVPSFTPDQRRVADEKLKNYFRCLESADEGLGRILATLVELGVDRDTVVILTSDNGLLLGEHDIPGAKQLAYEESIRVPFVLKYPRLVEGGLVRDELVSVLDIMPTILDLCGVAPPDVLHGRSLVPLIENESGAVDGWRSEVYYEHFLDERWPLRPHLQAIRTKRWKYITAPNYPGEVELYDLNEDPYELVNLAGDDSRSAVIADLSARLEERIHEAEASRLPVADH